MSSIIDENILHIVEHESFNRRVSLFRPLKIYYRVTRYLFAASYSVIIFSRGVFLRIVWLGLKV